MSMKKIKKIEMNCPICNQTHEVEERVRDAKVTIKDDVVTYKEKYYYCSNADEDENEFEPAMLVNVNLLNARNAYRRMHGLLTSDEIVSIRDAYGLSQVDLARLLGWGEATISRYESKAIQDEAYDTMLRIVKDNPLQVLDFLNQRSELFSEQKRDEIRTKIVEKVESFGKEYLTRRTLEGEYAVYGIPSDSNGFTLLNIDKLEAAISYIAEKVSNLFKVKLMKMLWYTDALSYKTHGHAVTGLVYKHDEMGALPVGHYSLMNLERLEVKEESSYNYDSMLHIYPTANMNYSILSNDDRDILDQVIKQFTNFNAKEIVEYMHQETAYTETKQGEIIPFELAKDIRAF